MVKKISAIVLALVLCLSVVVLPVSAAGFADDYALPTGAQMAFRIELDKEYYSAGDTATVSIYFVGDESLEFGAGAISIGVNTAIFNATDNTATTIKKSATSSDAYNSFYKAASSSTWSFLTNATNTNFKKIANNSTAEENAMYNAYVKLVIARDLNNATHENGQSNMNGIYGSDLSSTSEPIVTFQLKVASDVADGTVINVGIPSGSYTTAAKQTYMNYYSDPGNATTTTTLVDSLVDMSDCKLTATIGAATATYTVTYKDGDTVLKTFTDVEDGSATPTIDNPTKAGYTFKGWSPALADTVTGDVTYVAQWEEDLNVAALRQQIKFTKTLNEETNEYDDTIAFRVIADITNFEAIFGSAEGADDTATGMADNTYITEAGFLYNKGAAIDATAAETQIKNGTGSYTQQKNAYISSTAIAGKYAMACVVYDIPVADISDTLSVVAYVKYMQNGVEKIAMCTAYEGTFETLYNQYKPA